MSTPDEISDVAAALADIVARIVPTLPAGERGVWEVGEALRGLPGIEAVPGSRNTLRHREHELQMAPTAALQETADALASIRGLALASVPEVIALHALGVGASALLLRYAACAGERLIPFASAPKPLRDDARTRFRDDMAKLVASGHVHTGVRGLQDALVASESGTIVLTRWSALAPCSPAEGADWLANIDLLVRG
jgi:hypothetical protein